MEKEKVIKALENCIGCQPCKNCPYEKGYLAFPSCAVDMFKDALKLIKEMEQKTGHWDGERGSYTCSVCGCEGPEDGGYWASPFCPCCGAKMENTE